MAKDKGGTSDPFCVIRYGASTVSPLSRRSGVYSTLFDLPLISAIVWTLQVTSPTIPRTLNPVWSSGSETEARLEMKLFDSRGLASQKVELIVWDKDRIGKEYLGEVSIGLEEAWGNPQDWVGGVPPVGLDDEDNKVILIASVRRQ